MERELKRIDLTFESERTSQLQSLALVNENVDDFKHKVKDC